MGMTMTQKILAAHCGEAAVTAGQLINATHYIQLTNENTTPETNKENTNTNKKAAPFLP